MDVEVLEELSHSAGREILQPLGGANVLLSSLRPRCRVSYLDREPRLDSPGLD